MSGSSRPVYHQDYIARIRYSNALPPPPNPPKLLDIPNTGLASGQYTSAGYASRLAREQPLNIEADAELGMHVDLVGLPGVFEGDERSIQLLDNPPPPHPGDRPLLRPLAALGKPAAQTANVSFLRRTEYMTGGAVSTLRYDNSSASRDLFRTVTSRTAGAGAARKKRRGADPVNQNDPGYIVRAIAKGFDLAYPRDAGKLVGADGEPVKALETALEEREAWRRPQHPSRPDLKLLDAYPVLPDLGAFPDTGSYLMVKFQTNPVAVDADRYDDRLDVALLYPVESAANAEKLAVARAAYEARPEAGKPPPVPTYDYQLYLPSSSSVAGIKRKFGRAGDEGEDDNDGGGGGGGGGEGAEDALYDYANPATGARSFRYDRVRRYETFHQSGEAAEPYAENVALALHDGAGEDGAGARQKAAYYYPIAQRTYIRSFRKDKVASMLGGARAPDLEEDRETVDTLEVRIADPDEDMRAHVAEHLAKFDPLGAEVEG
ncbi:Paf1-domain-containing protein [Lineolata rhizophorae]|uniref:Paf1-domain-containing protein n=1 Tax=Lineolata rhizophorae TaxID=578093 RepID=A0A6A6P2D5_9PEZI|nr:Paf1-domain-containing protein [Lineolata rhizophorae]